MFFFFFLKIHKSISFNSYKFDVDDMSTVLSMHQGPALLIFPFAVFGRPEAGEPTGAAVGSLGIAAVLQCFALRSQVCTLVEVHQKIHTYVDSITKYVDS